MDHGRYIPAMIAACALLVIVTACGTNGDDRAVVTPTAAIKGNGTTIGSSIDPTPTADAEENATEAGNSVVPTPTADAGGEAVSSIEPMPTPIDIDQLLAELFASDNISELETSGAVTVSHNPAWSVPPSLDEQIYYSDVIARASLKSATSTTEKVVGGYQPVHELRFIVHEYLKGSGPSEILVVARGDEDTYKTVTKAHEVAGYTMSRRTTTWDNRQGVLFLRTLDGSSRFVARYASANATGAATTTAFAMYSGAPYEGWWEHTVDTLSRGWLPAGDAAGGNLEGGASGASSVVFIEDGSKTPYSTVTLGELKTKISEMTATLKAGKDIAGYEECIRRMIAGERNYRATKWEPLQMKVSLASGSSTGTEIFRRRDNDREPKYLIYYVTGADKDYFQAPIVDEDSDSSNGYFYTLSTTRPLPAGTYNIKHHLRSPWQVPCNFKPDRSNYAQWTVTVTAPSGTVHEAFFDPASTSLGVGASGGAGVISPASFNAGGATTTITRIIVSFGSMVTMQISPSVSLSGKHVEFIKVDGTMAARFSFDKGDLGGGIGIDGSGAGNGTSTAAAVTAEAQAQIAAAMAEAQATGSKMYFWFVSSAPWQAGDKLMLRIR